MLYQLRYSKWSIAFLPLIAMFGGCQPVPVVPGAVVVSPPAPVIVTNQGSEGRVARTMVAQSGVKLKVLFHTALNPDCTVMPGTSVRAVIHPSSGSLSIRPADDFVFFPPANPRSACNAKRVGGTLVEYHSKPGFLGQDTIAYDIFNANGSLMHVTLTINVK